MPRGRKRQPNILTNLKGIPDKPAFLTQEASEEWDRVTRELLETGNLSVVDRSSLTVYCQTYAKWLECEKHIAEHGMMQTTPNGYQIDSPWANSSKHYTKILNTYQNQFGLTTRSRNTIKQTEKKLDTQKPESKWSKFSQEA